MTIVRTLVAFILLTLSVGASAQTAVPHNFTAGSPARASEVNDNFSFLASKPVLYFRPWDHPVCSNFTDVLGHHVCALTSYGSTWDTTKAYTVLASLNVPDGTYFVTSKLSYFLSGAAPAWLMLECALWQQGVDPVEFASAQTLDESNLSLQSAFMVATGSGATLNLGCRLFGINNDGSAMSRVVVWNPNMAALQVGTLHTQ